MKHMRFGLFVIFAAITLAAPLSIVWKYENALRHGTLFKFRTQPVDPYDAFRGRYVTLAFEDNFLESWSDKPERQPRGALAHVRLAVGGDGFAKPVEVSWTQLAGDDVITVDYAHHDSWRHNGKRGWTLGYPFNRYYLPEDIAPLAEELYRGANRWSRAGTGNENANTYAAVRVRNGVGVIEELYINGKPVREAVREELERQKKERDARALEEKRHGRDAE